MLRLKEINSNGVAALEAGGKLTQEDYQKVLTESEAALDNHEKLHFYIELRELSGMEPAALNEDAYFDVKYRDRYGKVAVVGQRTWQEWATRLSDFLFAAPVRFIREASIPPNLARHL